MCFIRLATDDDDDDEAYAFLERCRSPEREKVRAAISGCVRSKNRSTWNRRIYQKMDFQKFARTYVRTCLGSQVDTQGGTLVRRWEGNNFSKKDQCWQPNKNQNCFVEDATQVMHSRLQTNSRPSHQRIDVLGSGCGAVCRKVTSETRGPRFESQHQQF